MPRISPWGSSIHFHPGLFKRTLCPIQFMLDKGLEGGVNCTYLMDWFIPRNYMSNFLLGRLHSTKIAVTASLRLHPCSRFVLGFTRAHCAEDLAPARVAECPDLASSRLRHFLRTETGVTIRACLRKFRLLKAGALLADCSLRISGIANRCGQKQGGY